MSERYFPDEKVRITIDAEVSDHSGDELEYTYPTALGTVEAVTVLDGSPVKVERLAPAEWPPRVGDMWRMRGNGRAVCVRDFEGRAGYEVALIDVRTGERFMPHELVPEELLYREDEQDGQAETSPYAHLVGRRIAVYTDDYGRETGTLTSAGPRGITVRVDRVIGGAPNRDYRAKDITRLETLADGQDGGDQS